MTPFRHGQVDIDGLQKLAERYLREEVSGFVALGTTGEAALLDHHERLSVLEGLLEVVGTRLTVVVGIGGLSTSDMVQEVHRFDRLDVGGYLVSAPAYICPDQRGLQWHFEQVARSTERPIVLYDVPHRTGVSIETQTVERLIECLNIVAIKACVPESFKDLCALPLAVLCGNDEAFIDCLLAGGTGGVLASAHLLAEPLAEVQERIASGKLEDAYALFDTLVPVINLLFSEPNPSGIKGALEMEGLIGRETRLPIMPASDDLMTGLRPALAQLSNARLVTV